MKKFSLIALLVTMFVLSACVGGAAAPAPASNVNIELTTVPDKPGLSDTELNILVKDKDGRPVDGAEVRVMANHTGMGHAGINGKAVEQSSGKYSVRARFSMAGDWKITIQVDKPGQPQMVKEVIVNVKRQPG